MNEDKYSSKSLTEMGLLLHHSSYQLFGFLKCSSSFTTSSPSVFKSPPTSWSSLDHPRAGFALLPARVQTNLCSQAPLKAASADLELQSWLCGVFDSSEQTRGAARSPSQDPALPLIPLPESLLRARTFPRLCLPQSFPPPACSQASLPGWGCSLATAKCRVKNALVLNNNRCKWSLPKLPFPFS